jgi:hypothetical protein
MKTYEVSYEKNGIYQSTIVKAQSEESARDFIKDCKNVDCIGCREKADISEDVRKGKPVLQAPYYAYCVEHSVNDGLNTYYESREEAIKEAKEQQELIENGEAEQEQIFVTTGEMTDGDYSVEEIVVF